VRLLSILITLVCLMTACQRYAIGAENSAPQVVTGVTEVVSEHSAEASATEASAETMVEHSTIPELDSARLVVQEAFGSARGSRAARAEASERLETARETLHTLSESGALAHWPELDEGFEIAIEKVREGTNDAPNALERLLVHLEEAGHAE
jgi:Na+-transporting methylmalonyl-CoA/oxaloacetate decarboxylase gamma subunit